jgi:hypothetical protein
MTPPPSLSSSLEELADWVEIRTLRSPERITSYNDMVGDLTMPGTVDALDEDPPNGADDSDILPDEKIELRVGDIFGELDDRAAACRGRHDLYPFLVSQRAIAAKVEAESSIYSFLLLLSWFGKDATRTPQRAEKLFETVCEASASGYLGHQNPIRPTLAFGWPRSAMPANFCEAVDKLCKAIGEGQGANRSRSGINDEKDAGLDVVAYSPFGDRRRGKLILFGQCATGQNWKDKRSELNLGMWCDHWLADSPVIPPIRGFFVPHKVGEADWDEHCRIAGILFDRCRITAFADSVPQETVSMCSVWSKAVIKKQPKR